MLQKLYKIVIKKLPSDTEVRHPLYAGLNENDFHKICCLMPPQQDEATFTILKEISPISELPGNLFIVIYPLKTCIQLESDVIPLYVTEHFLSNCSLAVGDQMFIKAVKCPSLEKIVIGTKTGENYNFLKDFDLRKELLSHSCNFALFCEGGRILSDRSKIDSDDILEIEKNIILDCSPFEQGTLTVNTSVIVVNMSEFSDFSYNQCKKQSETSAQNNIRQSKDYSSYIRLMNYTSYIVSQGVPMSPSSLPNVTDAIPFMLPSNSIMTPNHIFKIYILSKFYQEFITQMSKISDHFDPLNTIFVTHKALKKLGLHEDGWVKIELLNLQKISSNQSIFESKRNGQDVLNSIGPYSSVLKKDKSSPRMAYICSFSIESVVNKYFESDQIVYITPHLWFNLNKHPSKFVQPNSRLLIEPCDDTLMPSYAREAHAPLIQSPLYDGSINSDKLLYEFFQTPRYICKYDVICVDARGQISFCLKDNEQDLYRSSVIYFRISSIEGVQPSTGYLIDTKHCRLYQTGTSNNYIPATMETFYSSSDSHPIWDSPTSEGLKYYVYKIQDLIFPFLNLKNIHKFGSNILLTGQVGCGKTTVVKAVCKSLNLHHFQVNCHQFAGESSATTEARLKIMFDKGSVYAPCIIYLKNVHFIGKEKDLNNEDSRVLHAFCQLLKCLNIDNGWPIIVIASTTDQKLLSNDIFSAFLHHVHMEPPNEDERAAIIHDVMSICIMGNDLSPVYLAQRTAGYVLGDLCALVEQAVRSAYKRVRKLAKESEATPVEEEDMMLARIPVVQRDLLNALESLQSSHKDAIGAPRIPNVLFEDVGGLTDVKQEILDTIQLPLEHPEILLSGLRRSGLLLYGPPGTGKTLLAKAVATECSLNFLSVKGPELINMYVGQSEENVRAVFAEARSAVPCVIFFDELDSLAPNRGRSGDSGGVMDRVVSQLLAELDGLNKKTEVFVIGATNRPDLLDPALLRPGRFDRLLYVGIPEDKESKICVLRALTQKFPLAADVSLEEVAERCPPHLSGADLYSLCSNAVLRRVEENVKLIETSNLSPEEVSTEVRRENFLDALSTLISSVHPGQLIEYEHIKKNF